jgi:hypothetical protein
MKNPAKAGDKKRAVGKSGEERVLVLGNGADDEREYR